MSKAVPISIVIPTFEREAVLLDTIEYLTKLPVVADEILLVDQTPEYSPEVQSALERLANKGVFRWIRLQIASQPRALNISLNEVRNDIVLFLDDDIIPSDELVSGHYEMYSDPAVASAVGQVLQPNESPGPRRGRFVRTGLKADLNFPFWSNEPDDDVDNCMTGNYSARVASLKAIGGFDENFGGIAFRAETELCRRVRRAGGKNRFVPSASLRHLAAARGGYRSYADQFRSASTDHGVGDYYFAFVEPAPFLQKASYVFVRPFRHVRTKFHLRHPWWIPSKFIGEWRAMYAAWKLYKNGPKLMQTQRPDDFSEWKVVTEP